MLIRGRSARGPLVRSSSILGWWLNATLGKTDQGEHATDWTGSFQNGAHSFFLNIRGFAASETGAGTRFFLSFFCRRPWLVKGWGERGVLFVGERCHRREQTTPLPTVTSHRVLG